MTWSFYDSAGNLKNAPVSYPVLDDLLDVTLGSLADGVLLRYDTTGTLWGNTTSSTLLLSDAGQLQVPTTGSSGGLLIGGDTNLYRSAADVLSTDDRLTITVAGGSKNELQITSTTANTGIVIGADTNIYRSAANVLSTDDALTVAGTVTLGGYSNRSISAATTLAATDHVVFLLTSTAAGAFTVTLPTAVGRAGKVYTFIDAEANANVKNVTIDPNGAETLDGATTYVMNIPRETLTIVSNGTNWFSM